MSKIVLCIDSGNSYLEEIKDYLVSHGCKVYMTAGEEADVRTALSKIEKEEGRMDILLFGVDEQIPQDGAIDGEHDWETILIRLGGQMNRTRNAIDEALPLLRRGDLKRIGMITKKESSISYCRDDSNFGQHMTWAGLNMMGKLYFNQLRPEGFMFRWYCAEENAGGMCAGEYLLGGLCYDANEPYIHSDENRLVMRDSHLREIPW